METYLRKNIELDETIDSINEIIEGTEQEMIESGKNNVSNSTSNMKSI